MTSPTRPVQHARVDNAARYSHTACGAAVGETLINRIRVALAHGLTPVEVAAHFADAGTPEEVYLAWHAASVIDRALDEARRGCVALDDAPRA